MYVISKINQHVAFLSKNLQSSMGVPFLFGSNANVHQHDESQAIQHTAIIAALCRWKEKGADSNNIWTLTKY